MTVFKRHTWMADGVQTHFIMAAVCVGETTLLVNGEEWTHGFVVSGDTLIFSTPPVRMTRIELTYEVDYGVQPPREFNGGISYEGDL